MNTDTSNASKDLPAKTATLRGRGPTLLAERELEMVAAAGGASGGVLGDRAGRPNS